MSKRIPLLILFALLFTQCSLWESLTAYFNTYYNATRLFSESEEEVWSQPDTRYAGRNWLIRLDPPQGARARLSSVIEKCSKLLQYHEESDLVDDALLLIAKSYFYQGEFQKAERKCRELLDTQPNSSLCNETRVLLAYTLYKMHDAASAVKVAKEAIQKEGVSRDILARAYLLLAQDEFERQNLTEAMPLFARAGEEAGTEDLRAVAYLRAAECALQTRNYDAAQRYYKSADDATSNYVIEFRAILGGLCAQARNGEQRAAIERLREIRANQNYREYFGEVDFATAEAYQEAGDIASAVAQYSYVDTAYARTEYGARGGYGLGQLYENDLKLLDSALAAYNRSKVASSTSEAGLKSKDRADLLTRYFASRAELIRCDTLLRGIHPVPDSTVLKAAGKGDSISTAVRDSILAAASKRREARIDSLGERRAFAMSEIANVFYTGLDLKDSAWAWYARVAEEFPASMHTARALFVIAQILSSDSTRNRAVPDSLLREVIRRFPNSDFAVEARKQLGLPVVPKAGIEGAEAYGEAEKLIMRGKGADALTRLEKIVATNSKSPIAPKALYAIGWVYENQLAMPESSLAAYKRLAALYPSSAAATSITPMLAAVDQERRAQIAAPATVKDTVSVGTQQKEVAVKTAEQRPEAPMPVPASAGGRNSGRESRLRSRRIE